MTKSRTAIALLLCALAAPAQSHVPKGRNPPSAALTQAIQKALPEGATEAQKPLPVAFPPLGKIHIVTFRSSAADPKFHGLVLVPEGASYRALPLPEPDAAGAETGEEIVTSVFGATAGDSGDPRRVLVILFYTHQPDKPGSSAHGRIYVYASGAFTVGEARSQKLEGVRTAAVARLRLAETAP